MRRQKTYHYIYKITRFDGKYYIGLHSTNNLDDGYFGSGKYLRNSINYHGLEKHTKEIIEFLPDRQSLKDRERELVTEECVSDPLCMNLKKGGEGGWDFCNEMGFNRYYRKDNPRVLESLKKANKRWMELISDDLYRQTFCNKISKTLKDGYQSGRLVSNWIGKKHTNDTKEKLRTSQLNVDRFGDKNPSYNTCWIYSFDLKVSKRININELELYISKGWSKGRVIKFDVNVENKASRGAKSHYIRALLNDKKRFEYNKEIDKYREYYRIYSDLGWSEFVNITGYDKSKANLVQRCKKLLPEFVSQNGKKRGKNLMEGSGKVLN